MIILIAEDDLYQQTFYKECLAEIDHDIHLVFAQNGYDLLGKLAEYEFKQQIPDLIILDLNMPYLNGRYVLAKMKEDMRFSKVKVVILTASEYPIDRYFGEMLRTPYYVKVQDKKECIDLFKSILFVDPKSPNTPSAP